MHRKVNNYHGSERPLLAESRPIVASANDPLRSFAVRLLGSYVDDRFNPILLGNKNEGCIVAIAIFWPRPWCAIAPTTVAQRSGMEFVHLIRLRRGEGQVKAFSGNHHVLCKFQAQLIVTTFVPVAHSFVVSKDLDIPQRF